MRIHRRQFVLSPARVEIAPEWRTERVPGAGYLTHCPELPVCPAVDAQGGEWRLLGLAVQTDPDLPSPLEQIASTPTHLVSQSTSTWAGRWVLIGNGDVQMDAAGMLGCFYRVDCKATSSTAAVCVSSSAALLSNEHRDRNDFREVHHARGIDWFPPPHSKFPLISRLLPSQTLDLSNGAIKPRRLFRRLPETQSYADTLDRLQQFLVTGLRNIASMSGSLWLPLTGGHDSRLLLATAVHARVPIQTFTQLYRYMDDCDRRFPPELASLAGVEHRFIPMGEIDATRMRLFDEHTAGHSADQDRKFVSRGQFDWTTKDDLLLRGVGLEAGCPRAPSRNKFPQPEFSSKVPGAAVLQQGWRRKEFEPSLVRALNAWAEWCAQTPHADLDWRDRFYLEQRLAGWGSSIEQALDIIKADRIHLANSETFFANVYHISSDIRQDSTHQKDLIRRMAPDLMCLPFNPADSWPKAFAKRIIRRVGAACAS